MKKEEYIQNIEDKEILKKDVKYNTKKRLIVLCNKRTEEIKEKIKKLENK